MQLIKVINKAAQPKVTKNRKTLSKQSKYTQKQKNVHC